jgi:hypothetical protein
VRRLSCSVARGRVSETLNLLFPQPDQDCIVYTTELSYKLTEAEEVCFLEK